MSITKDLWSSLLRRESGSFFFVFFALAATTVQAQTNYEPYLFTTVAGSAGSTGNADGASGDSHVLKTQ